MTKTSATEMVRQLYEDSADFYAHMIDVEIDLPVYSDVLTRLAQRLVGIRGPVIDSSCGAGHMLLRYHERFDPERAFVGIDLSPRMVAIARDRLCAGADVVVGDMVSAGRGTVRNGCRVAEFLRPSSSRSRSDPPGVAGMAANPAAGGTAADRSLGGRGSHRLRWRVRCCRPETHRRGPVRLG